VPGVELCWPDARLEPGTIVAVRVAHLGFWSLNFCRIIYLIDDNGAVERFGFGYGTLAEHAERGEERFTVEWNRADDSVWVRHFSLFEACGAPDEARLSL